MSEIRDYLEGVHNAEIPIKRRNPQTGEMEDVYFYYDDDREELVELPSVSRASSYNHQTMAFAQAMPEDENSASRRDEWRSLAHHNYNEDGSHFERVLRNTLGEEGGYVDDPNLIEEPTNRGITQSTLVNYRRRHPQAGYPEHVRNLTADQTRNIYFQDYYQPYRIYNIQDERLSNLVFDMHAMTNPEDVARTIQEGLNDSGYNVEVDGTFGSESIGALNAAAAAGDTDRVAENIIRRRRNYLNSLSNSSRYRGWIPRANRY